MDIFMDVFKPFLIISSAVFTIVVGLGILFNFAADHSCKITARAMHREYYYSFWTDCLVKDNNGKFFPLYKLQYNTVEIQ